MIIFNWVTVFIQSLYGFVDGGRNVINFHSSDGCNLLRIIMTKFVNVADNSGIG